MFLHPLMYVVLVCHAHATDEQTGISLLRKYHTKQAENCLSVFNERKLFTFCSIFVRKTSLHYGLLYTWLGMMNQENVHILWFGLVKIHAFEEKGTEFLDMASLSVAR